MGFYYKNFLEAPPIPENTNKLIHYKEIERFILDNIQGARKVKSKARTHKNGRTEWVFCKQQPLKDVFKLAHETYGGKYHNYELTKDVFQHNENGIKYFEGKINFK
jgi:hypothetical protein